jgi:hypothetical protein
MRTRMGSAAEIEASKAWLRSQGLTGLFEEPLLEGGEPCTLSSSASTSGC